MGLIIPEGYKSALTVRQTQEAIKKVKDFFERDLAIQLSLTRVTAPVFVDAGSGLNDDLNGYERPVDFLLPTGEHMEIVHSLAKWKRMALGQYGFSVGEGLYTDMNAIRRDEETDNLHSVFVDQWDWESVIRREDRNRETLHRYVRRVYRSLRHTENYIATEYSFIDRLLPDEIEFVTSSELLEMYPGAPPREREYRAVREHGAVFVEGIGGALADGKPHDGRAPDYDDWTLNGDIIVYDPTLDCAFEISSMGVRVDGETMMRQLRLSGCEKRAELPFHRALLAGELPYTVGGGIGQSRMCMFFLRKAHIGEVQCSLWPREVMEEAQKKGLQLL